MKSDPALRHEERPRPGTRLACTLGREGIAVEEYTSEVKTHEDLIYYDEVWDSRRTTRVPRAALSGVAVLTAAWASLAALHHPLPAWGFAGGVLAAAWLFLLARARVLTVRFFNYEGQELVALEGVPTARFVAFLEALDARVAQGRYPLQGLFETLPLGHMEWKGLGRSWSCRFAYDRLVFERRRLFGWEERTYASLMALEPPVRLAWKLPMPAVAGLAVALALAGALSAWGAGLHGAVPWPWVWAALSAGLACALWIALGLRVAVQVKDGNGVFLSPGLPWWQKAQRQELLKLLARLIALADGLSELDHENYWEYHRSKLAVLKEQGFLEPWPYRSALARLNSQEREDFGE